MQKLKERRISFRGSEREFGLSSGESSGKDLSETQKSYAANRLLHLANLCSNPH